MSYYNTALIGAFFGMLSTLVGVYLKQNEKDIMLCVVANSVVVSIISVFLVFVLRLIAGMNFATSNTLIILGFVCGITLAILQHKGFIPLKTDL